jgi:hypothetical protein
LDLGLESEPSSQFLKEMEPNRNQDSILWTGSESTLFEQKD